MLVKTAQVARTVFVVVALCLLPGCDRGTPSAPHGQDSQGTTTSAVSTPDSGGPNRCGLLTDDEVRDAIGPHSAGTNDVTNEWGLQSCRWLTNSGQKNATSSGWIEVASFNREIESWAREQAKG